MDTEIAAESDRAIQERAMLLSVARDMVGQQGYAKFNMANFAKEANVSRRTLYNYFSGKSDVVQRLINEEAKRFLQQMQRDVPHDQPFKDYLLDCLVYSIVNQRHNPYFETLSGKSQEMAQRYQTSKEIAVLWGELFHNSFQQAQQNGEIGKQIQLERLLKWFGRLVVSYAFYRDESESELEIRNTLQMFFIDSL